MWIERSVERGGKTRVIVAGLVVTIGDPVAAKRGKCPVAAVCGAAIVSSYDSEMISGVCS